MSDDDRPGIWRTLTRIGVIVTIVVGVVSLIGFLGIRATSSTASSPTPTPVPTPSPTPVNCLGHQGNVTIRNLDIPPSQLTVTIDITALAGESTAVQVYFYCDGNTVQFPNSDHILCNAVALTYSVPGLGLPGPAWYGGTVAAVSGGQTYTFTYARADTTSYAIPVTAMPQVRIATPSPNATIPIPKNGSIVIKYGDGNSDSRVSAQASDSAQHEVAASNQDDTGVVTLTGDFTGFVAGPGKIGVTRAKRNVGISDPPFGGVTLENYQESASIDVTWQ